MTHRYRIRRTTIGGLPAYFPEHLVGIPWLPFFPFAEWFLLGSRVDDTQMFRSLQDAIDFVHKCEKKRKEDEKIWGSGGEYLYIPVDRDI